MSFDDLLKYFVAPLMVGAVACVGVAIYMVYIR